MDAALVARHIQDFATAEGLQKHWGYADRVVPCTNDKGSCEYLDVVYHSHDLGMLYTAIIWATIGGIVLIWGIGRRFLVSPTPQEALFFESSKVKEEGALVSRPRSGVERLKHAISAFSRRHFLPEFARPIFGRTTRLQVAILAVLSGYLIVFTFVGMVYNKWVTPVKKLPGVYNTRTTLGPFSNRVGTLAYALTPLSVVLSSRENILSLITGVPYQSFIFLHRWVGYIILAQSALHTIAWCIVEIRLYQPQPSVAIEWITQEYMIWGIVAMILLLLLWALTTPWAIRAFGYEFFRKAHYVLAMIYIGACWAHWANLKVFMLPGLLVWLLDRTVRFARTALLHYRFVPETGSMAFSTAKATITTFPDEAHGDVVRLDMAYPHDSWNIGEHFYLCFPELSIWQSHPFTPLSMPTPAKGVVTHSYIVRAKGGETKKLALLAAKKLAAGPSPSSGPSSSNTSLEKHTSATTNPLAPTTPVILTGPYGQNIVSNLSHDVNVLCIAGGTGITFVLPVLHHLAAQPTSFSRNRKVSLIWAIRRRTDKLWVKHELERLKDAPEGIDISVQIFITREDEVPNTSEPALPATTTSNKTDEITRAESVPSSSGSSDAGEATHPIKTHDIAGRHPDLKTLVTDFVANTVAGRTAVYVSGPPSMTSDLRTIVAGCNESGKVWAGDEKGDVELIYDDRLEW